MQRLVIALLLGTLCGCRSTRPVEAPSGAHLRILTYNVNWGAPSPELAVEIIRQSRADIVCLQETTPAWEELIRQALRRDYAFMDFRASQGRMGGGLAFLSKGPAREIAYMPSETGWFDGWIMAFETALGAVQVLNVHLRPPVSDSGNWASGYFSTPDDRLREMERFYAGHRPGMPLVISGDFNDGENSPVVRWLEQKGMANALPQFDGHAPTWEWRTSFVKLKRRMDHIVYSPELHCFSARVIKEGASGIFPSKPHSREVTLLQKAWGRERAHGVDESIAAAVEARLTPQSVIRRVGLLQFRPLALAGNDANLRGGCLDSEAAQKGDHVREQCVHLVFPLFPGSTKL